MSQDNKHLALVVKKFENTFIQTYFHPDFESLFVERFLINESNLMSVQYTIWGLVIASSVNDIISIKVFLIIVIFFLTFYSYLDLNK